MELEIAFMGPPDGNTVPQVDAGEDQQISWPVNSVILDATVQDDGKPSPQPVLIWAKAYGPGSVTFGNPGCAQTSAVFSESGAYVLRLWVWDGAIIEFDDVRVEVLDPNAVPVTLCLKVNDGVDDTFAYQYYNLVSSSRISLGAQAYWGGFRFRAVPIPQGARVESAYLRYFECCDGIPMTLKIHADNSGCASDFSAQNIFAHRRQCSDAGIVWTHTTGNTWQTSPDIRDVVQSAIDRFDWNTGNDVALLVRPMGGRCTMAWAYEGSPSLAAELVITYRK